MGQLRIETAGAIATLTIESAGKRNAISSEMWMQFEPELAALARDRNVKVLVIRGAGADFSAGADIADLEQILSGPNDGGVMTQGENALAAFAKPTIAAIDGYCVGGGWEIAGACDIRIASHRSTFGITPSRLGIVYPVSGIRRLVGIAGPAVAKYLLFSGELIDATSALSYGLVSKVLPDEEFWNEAYQLAELLATRSQFSIHAMKPLVDLIGGSGVAIAELDTLVEQERTGSTEDRTIGVAAFLAKTAPEFTWRG